MAASTLALAYGLSAPIGLLVADADVLVPNPAAAADQRSFLILTGTIVAGVILLGALIISWVDRWRKRAGEPALTVNQQMATFRELYERGEISPQEFARIRALLGDRLKEELDVPVLTPLDEPVGEPAGEPPRDQPPNGQPEK